MILNDVISIDLTVRHPVRRCGACDSIDSLYFIYILYIQLKKLVAIEMEGNYFWSHITPATTAATANNAPPGPLVFAIDLLVVVAVAVAVVLDTGFVVYATLESTGHPNVFQALNVAATSASPRPSIQSGQSAKYILSIAPSHE